MKWLVLISFLTCCSASAQFTFLGRTSTAPVATFSIIADDNNASDSTVNRIVREYGFVPNFALKTNTLTTTTAPLYRRYYLNGSSILGHTVHHQAIFNNPAISQDSIRNEILNANIAIYNLTGVQVSGFVTPQSVLNATFYNLTDSIFPFAFTTLNNVYDRSVGKGRLSRFSLEGNSIDSIKAKIDAAIANKWLVVFYLHALPSTTLDGDGLTTLSEAKLREALAYLKTKTDLFLCRVLNTERAIKEYYQ